MTEAPGRREQVREERRRQILEAALAVFSRKGFHAANVSDVAAEAGVSQGTIYWYFDSKEELFEAAVLSAFTEIGAEALAALEQYETATEKLRGLARAVEGFADVAQNLFALFLAYWSYSTRREETGQVWTDLLVEYKDFVVSIIEEGIRNGEFRPVDAEPLVWALLAAYDGLAAYLMLIPGLDMAQASHVFIETLLNGLLAENRGKPAAS